MFSDGNTFKIGPKSLLREKGFSIQPNGVKIISELCCFPSFFLDGGAVAYFQGLSHSQLL